MPISPRCRPSRSTLVAAIAFAATTVTALPLAIASGGPEGDARALLGWDDLIARLGAKAPTGAGIGASAAEAIDPGGNWGPNEDSPEFADVTITFMSPGTPGSSAHATSVFRNLLGGTTSVAPGVSEAFAWEAADWIFEFLNQGDGPTVAPDVFPDGVRVHNNSWIGSFSAATANEVLRRHDIVVQRDDVLITSGVANNPNGNPFLMIHAFNGVTVGIRDGGHGTSATSAPLDGPGRMRPELVGVSSVTSFATPQVGAVGAVLFETAATDPSVAGEPLADDIEIIKSVMFTSATKENIATGVWTNAPALSGPERGTTTTPIDDIVGAGTVNVDRAHLLLTAGRKVGSDDASVATMHPSRGWDGISIQPGTSRYWGISIPEGAEALSASVVWNRRVRLANGSWTFPDFDLHLWRRGAAGELQPLTGDAGLGVFEEGNVTSESAVDNVELLHLAGLAAGEYVLEVRRMDTGGFTPAFWPVGVSWFGPEPPSDPADVDGDGVVALSDLLEVLANWGPCPGCPADVDSDGEVALADLLAVIANWTP